MSASTSTISVLINFGHLFWSRSQYLHGRSYLSFPNITHMACGMWILVSFYPIWAIVFKKWFYFAKVHLLESHQQFLFHSHKVTTIVWMLPLLPTNLLKASLKESVSILLQMSRCTALIARQVKMIPYLLSSVLLSFIRKEPSMSKATISKWSSFFCSFLG